MNKITLGKTGLVIEKNGLGCLPIQRISEQDAVYLLHKAYDGGINFYDTARAYSDSEQKVGAAFSSMRDKIVLATKTGAQTAEGFRKDLETSLRTLKTDYIDIYQFHNPSFCPKPGDGTGLYWPYANKKYDGIYGMIDDFGTITSQKSFIHIEGNTVTSEETSSETSEDSVNMFALLPEAYYSDNTMVSVMEDVLYLNVYFDASARGYEEIANELWNIYKSADLSGINTILIRMNDDVFYEVNTRVDNSTPVFVEDGYQKWAVFLYGDEASINTNDVIEETEYDPSTDPALSGIYEETESTEE